MSAAAEPSLADDLGSLKAEMITLLARIAERDEMQTRDRQRLAEVRAITTGIERAMRKLAEEASAAAGAASEADAP